MRVSKVIINICAIVGFLIPQHEIANFYWFIYLIGTFTKCPHMIACSFLINPIILRVLIKMHWICSSKLNFASKNKPRGIWSLTWWTGFSSCLHGSGLKFVFKGSKIDPCGTPVFTFVHDQNWPFKTTLCWRFFKKSIKRHSSLSFIPFCFNLKSFVRHLFKNFRYVQKYSSYSSAFIKRSKNVVSDWQKFHARATRSKYSFGEIRILYKKYFSILSYMIRSKILLQIGRRETGR